MTADFICSRIRPSLRYKLNHEIDTFRELTNSTYLDWILTKARRIFLILAETGIPNKIFDVVDAAWDDDDLPVSAELISEFCAPSHGDGSIVAGRNKPGVDTLTKATEAKFHLNQFEFLLRELERGDHIDYADNEIVPLEYVHRMPPAVSLQRWYRVRVAKGDVLVRRKFVLPSDQQQSDSKPTADRSFRRLEEESRAIFLRDVGVIQRLNHPHIMEIFATYTFRKEAFTMSSFNAQHTLQTFIDHRNPIQIQGLSRQGRQALLFGWIHCLSSAVAAIHDFGLTHSSIRPSNIVVDDNNSLAFSDIPSLKTFSQLAEGNEAYDYSAPEVIESTSLDTSLLSPFDAFPSPPDDSSVVALSISSPSRVSSRRRFRRFRKSAENDSTSASTTFGSLRSRPSSVRSTRNISSSAGLSTQSRIPQGSHHDYSISPLSNCQSSDIFSLGCVILDILSFILKRKGSDFVRHRQNKSKDKRVVSERRDAVPDRMEQPGSHQGGANNNILWSVTEGVMSADRPSFSSCGDYSISQMSPTSPVCLYYPDRDGCSTPSSPRAARSISRPDASFHANLDRVFDWMDILEQTVVDASGSSFSKTGEATDLCNSVRTILSLCRDMLQVDPTVRPAAHEVVERICRLKAYGFNNISTCCENQNPSHHTAVYDRVDIGLGGDPSSPIGNAGHRGQLVIKKRRQTETETKIKSGRTTVSTITDTVCSSTRANLPGIRLTFSMGGRRVATAPAYQSAGEECSGNLTASDRRNGMGLGDETAAEDQKTKDDTTSGDGTRPRAVIDPGTEFFTHKGEIDNNQHHQSTPRVPVPAVSLTTRENLASLPVKAKRPFARSPAQLASVLPPLLSASLVGPRSSVRIPPESSPMALPPPVREGRIRRRSQKPWLFFDFGRKKRMVES